MKAPDKYPFTSGTEVAIAMYAAKRPSFYGRLGYTLESKRMNNETVALVLQTVHEIARDAGRSPSSEHTVLQRLRTRFHEGKITEQQINGVIDMLIESDEASLPLEDELIAEVAPIIQRMQRADLVRGVIDEFSKHGDFDEVGRKISDIQRIGKQDTSIGLTLGADAIEAIDSLRTAQRMSFGIDELDRGTGGGLIRGCQCLYIGASGAGKSMALSQASAMGVMDGLTTAVATLEVGEAIWMARQMAAITRVPTSDILTQQNRDILLERLEQLHPLLGDLNIKQFTPKMTTVPDIVRWVDSIEQRKGKKVELLIVDYVDKVGSHNRQDQNEYAAQGTAAESLRVFAEQRAMWSYTASQAIRRAGDKKRKLDLDDGADSQHKARIADMVITLNATADEELIYRVVKWRHGKGDFESSPIPTAFYCGRLTE